MKKKGFNLLMLLLGGAVCFTACNENEDSPATTTKGEVAFEITDAPSDDANIKGVFVTVTDIKVNGQSVSGFNKQTIDLKAYQDGETKLLGTTQLDAKRYNNVALILDLEHDADGNSPGCYVLTDDDVKFKLKNTNTGKTDIILDQPWEVYGNGKNNIVMDFDLRKSIRYSDDPAIRYSFVSDNNLSTAVRLVTKEETGTIKGSYTDQGAIGAEKIVVYAYKKGTFNASSETTASGSDNISFRNAIAAAEVKGSGTYTLAFLEQGEYELHFVAYNKNIETGRYNHMLLRSEININGAVSNTVKVQAGASVSVSTIIKGLI